MWYLLLFALVDFASAACTPSTTPLSEDCSYDEVCTGGGGSATLNMVDSYGDGWNGYTLCLGTEDAQCTGGTEYTITSGYSSTASISSLTTTILSLKSPGSWLGEVSWTLTCEDGTVLASYPGESTSSWTLPSCGGTPTCTSKTCPAGHLYKRIVVANSNHQYCNSEVINPGIEETSLTSKEAVIEKCHEACYNYAGFTTTLAGGSIGAADICRCRTYTPANCPIAPSTWAPYGPYDGSGSADSSGGFLFKLEHVDICVEASSPSIHSITKIPNPADFARYDVSAADGHYCSPHAYLDDPGSPNYPPRLSSSHPLSNADAKIECANRCLADTTSGSGAFYLLDDNLCGCTGSSNNDCTTTAASRPYTSYKITLESTGCSPGQEPIDGSCTDCVAGKYSSDGTACVDCGTNEEPNAAKTGCQCAAGYELERTIVENLDHQYCNPGVDIYADEGIARDTSLTREEAIAKCHTHCYDYAGFTTSVNGGSVTADGCSCREYTPANCPGTVTTYGPPSLPGMASDSSGGYVFKLEHVDVCVSSGCSQGQEPVDGSCADCGAGKYSSDGDACASCGDNEYQDDTGQPSCKTCVDPHAEPNVNKTGCQCIEGHGGSPCATCEAGQYSSGGACTACGDNEYQNQAGQPSCKTCDNGYVNNEKTTCTLCPLNDHKYDWGSGCPAWSTNDGCFCNCTGSGFTGKHCDICAEGMGWNGVLGAGAKCTGCEFPTVNDQTSHNALCSHDFCPPGSGTTSDVNSWDPDNSTTENCVACTGSTVSPSYYGQCAEVLCDDYMTVKDIIDHELENTNQTNCEPCSGYNVGASCSPIVCESGRMKTPHDGSSDGVRYIDYNLEPNDQDNCIPCGVDEVVSADGTSCVKVVCPDGFKILVVDPTLAYNAETNCVPCEGFTYAKGTECIDFDCAPYRVKENFDRTEEASKCGEQCTGDTILDVNDLTQCVACAGDTVVNSDHTECVTSVCRVGYTVSVTDRSLTPDDYHQDANCEEVDECLTASCSSCDDVVNGYVCTEEIELRQGIEAFANANEHICPSGFRLSSKPPVNAADIGLRNGACPPLKVFAERYSIHEGVFRSKLVEDTASVVVEGKACKYTYEDLISL